MTTLYAGRDGKIRQITIPELFTLRNKPEYSDTIIWADLESPTEEEEETLLVNFFLFHHLAVEDCQRERLTPHIGDHYPKVEDYHDCLFVIFNPVDRPIEENENSNDESKYCVHFPTRQMNAFLGTNFLVTHHYEPSLAINYVQNLCLKNPQTLQRGPDFLFHIIIDEIVDNYTPVIEYFDKQLDELEACIFQDFEPSTLPKILSLKKGIIRLRKISTYQREILNRLSRGEFTLISTEEMLYYRNVYDHLVRISDLVESYRENIAGLLEAYLSVNSNRMNQVMKVLTVISTIFLPLTFISSIYGMNFRFMPELEWRYGYFIIWSIIIGIGAFMLRLFSKKGWLE